MSSKSPSQLVLSSIVSAVLTYGLGGRHGKQSLHIINFRRHLETRSLEQELTCGAKAPTTSLASPGDPRRLHLVRDPIVGPARNERVV